MRLCLVLRKGGMRRGEEGRGGGQRGQEEPRSKLISASHVHIRSNERKDKQRCWPCIYFILFLNVCQCVCV